MKTVEFIKMEDGTRAEYEFLDQLEVAFNQGLADRLLNALRALAQGLSGYQVNRLQHCLQGATRATRAGEPDDIVIAILLHDIGDGLAPYSHGELAAAILRPFVRDKVYWIIKHHGIFQMYYYAHYSGKDRNARERYRDHPWYQDAIDFCARYDQNCFDPDYDSEPLEFFEPLLRRLVAQPRFENREHHTGHGAT